ncbi:hypothetical protein [Microbacterium sp. TPU 3598]|uniref:hypothetical protein n=1 Tax=Microbacterium sp. TPU 3598 TaxID=1938334 RepID=UPI0012FE3399|nr:hypothetical protein [Microbacterium sp. TPU 3598]
MAKIEAAKGKPVIVKLVPAAQMATVTAYWHDSDEAVLIFLRREDSPYYQVRGLHHELAHILFDHPSCSALQDLVPENPQLGGRVMRGRMVFGPGALPIVQGEAEMEGEAEYLSILLARLLLRPDYLREESEFAWSGEN